MGFDIEKLQPSPVDIDGVWMDYAEGARVKLARMNNPEYEAYLEKLVRNYVGLGGARRRRRTNIPVEEMKPLIIKAMAHTVVKDWSGFQEQSVDVPYAPETAERWMLQYDELYRDWQVMASDDEKYNGVDEGN